MIPDEKPHKILIIGAGAIGVEFACFYNDFGSEVTLIELQKIYYHLKIMKFLI